MYEEPKIEIEELEVSDEIGTDHPSDFETPIA